MYAKTKVQRSRKDTAEKLRHQQDTPHAVASRSKSKNHRQQNNKTPKRTRNTQRTKPPKRHPHYAGNQKRHPQEGKTCHLDTTADKPPPHIKNKSHHTFGFAIG
jgi:hypothetical protein